MRRERWVLNPLAALKLHYPFSQRGKETHRNTEDTVFKTDLKAKYRIRTSPGGIQFNSLSSNCRFLGWG